MGMSHLFRRLCGTSAFGLMTHVSTKVLVGSTKLAFGCLLMPKASLNSTRFHGTLTHWRKQEELPFFVILYCSYCHCTSRHRQMLSSLLVCDWRKMLLFKFHPISPAARTMTVLTIEPYVIETDVALGFIQGSVDDASDAVTQIYPFKSTCYMCHNDFIQQRPRLTGEAREVHCRLKLRGHKRVV